MATVVIERLGKQDYLPDCASLPRDYGRSSWESRPEVAAIREAAFSALDRLEAETGFAARLRGRKVFVKPNLVMVYDRMGTAVPVSPESTDPRVLDALVLWLGRHASSIDIVESSGRGSPTRAAFAISGIDRLARRRGCGLVALDEEPVERYYLPKARFQREILVPRILSPVVRGEAAFVSVPKMKTNLYTGVTLGFKNAMGLLPYNLRQRHHHYAIERKLVEMLWLLKPDLVLVDGVVGGEGECPAPVDPVDSRVIAAGDHAVETDRVVTRLMGFDPAGIELMRVADELGFGSPRPARVIGDASPVPFRPADASLFSERVRERFPGLAILVGMDRRRPASPPGPGFARELERACWGGCAATTRTGLAFLEAEGVSSDAEAVLVIGPGVAEERGGERLWYDREGGAWTEERILALPGRKLVVGSCGKALGAKADLFVEGCMPLANAPHMALHRILGTPCRIVSPGNRRLPGVLLAMAAQRSARRRLIKAGERLDVRFETEDDPPLADPPACAPGADWAHWPLPPADPAERERLLAFEDGAAAASLRGCFAQRFTSRPRA